mmetsp:Transcript_131483/g.227734  ORF Transcript_131483/g.227734 Transcript_131483/m.227734 type:complete len:267 (-) Transcript_131483:107-907(-)
MGSRTIRQCLSSQCRRLATLAGGSVWTTPAAVRAATLMTTISLVSTPSPFAIPWPYVAAIVEVGQAQRWRDMHLGSKYFLPVEASVGHPLGQYGRLAGVICRLVSLHVRAIVRAEHWSMFWIWLWGPEVHGPGYRAGHCLHGSRTHASGANRRGEDLAGTEVAGAGMAVGIGVHPLKTPALYLCSDPLLSGRHALTDVSRYSRVDKTAHVLAASESGRRIQRSIFWGWGTVVFGPELELRGSVQSLALLLYVSCVWLCICAVQPEP